MPVLSTPRLCRPVTRERPSEDTGVAPCRNVNLPSSPRGTSRCFRGSGLGQFSETLPCTRMPKYRDFHFYGTVSQGSYFARTNTPNFLTISLSWRRESETRCHRAGPHQGLSPGRADGPLLPVSPHGCPSVRVCVLTLSQKDQPHWTRAHPSALTLRARLPPQSTMCWTSELPCELGSTAQPGTQEAARHSLQRVSPGCRQASLPHGQGSPPWHRRRHLSPSCLSFRPPWGGASARHQLYPGRTVC